EAAGEQGRYWDMLQILFLYQPEWGDHRQPRPELIPTYAERIGLDMAAFEPSYQGIKHRAKVERDRADADRLGVRGTPSFFVNGRPLEQLGYAQLKAMIDEELAKYDLAFPVSTKILAAPEPAPAHRQRFPAVPARPRGTARNVLESTPSIALRARGRRRARN